MKKLVCVAALVAAAFMLPAEAGAAGVRGHAMTGHVIGPRVRVFANPAFGFYDPFWYPGWGYAYPYVVPADNTGGLRLEVTPKTAQVFVDGYYAGVVDDFNGHFQHLDMAPGGHHIELRQPGFQPMGFDVYVQPGHTSDYKGALIPAA